MNRILIFRWTTSLTQTLLVIAGPPSNQKDRHIQSLSSVQPLHCNSLCILTQAKCLRFSQVSSLHFVLTLSNTQTIWCEKFYCVRSVLVLIKRLRLCCNDFWSERKFSSPAMKKAFISLHAFFFFCWKIEFLFAWVKDSSDWYRSSLWRFLCFYCYFIK